MKNYEKKALIKFTSIYFFLVAILVLILGFLYYWQQQHLIMKKSVMQMLQYSQVLVKTDFKYSQEGFSYELKKNQKIVFDIPTKEGKYYTKVFPISKKEGFIKVSTLAKPIDEEISKVKKFTISLQIILLIVFLTVSYFLAKLSIKPMKETISHLDRFILDIIHDLNTPSTAIILNSDLLLEKEDDEKKIKKLNRIKMSADTISSLYKNLEIILNQKLLKEKIDIEKIVKNKVEDFKLLFPKIKFVIDIKSNSYIKTNENALIRILDNLLTNSCKYSNEQNPEIYIVFEKQILSVKDNGKGVKYPKKIFERYYKEDNLGYGIGMHIVHRLCDNLDIKLFIQSIEDYKGTEVILNFDTIN
ncbi:sensor histidine kinase [Arcobacter arenosus]|uniref:histidine kinase n=1 Tax=Arcobacter arenosus TaxID=2576037 RepID=A0A5R8Y5T9_9BACT|nr:HAMP domain-containing sensor histidine kinase [Arcobacter arenosus]TLP40862.1 HAMP domain-containing histidine kinase [Arcobacter arenosus]